MLRVYQVSNDRICESQDQEGPIHLYYGPQKPELKSLVESYKLDEHTLSSALDPDEISRLEFEPDHVAMIIKRPRNYSVVDDLLFKVTSIGLFIFRDRIIIVMPEDI
jgi:magnesium transporter